MAIHSASEALSAATASGTLISLSFKTEIETIKSQIDQKTLALVGYIDLISRTHGDLDVCSGHATDVEAFYNELVATLSAADVETENEEACASAAAECQEPISNLRDPLDEVKSRIEQANNYLDEAIQKLGEILGSAETVKEKFDDLSNKINESM